MVHAWAYAALIVLAAAAAGTGVAYYYGFGQPTVQNSVQMNIQVQSVARGGTTVMPGVTVTISYAGNPGTLHYNLATDFSGKATFYVPANAAVTVTDSLAGYKVVQTGTSALTVTLYHVAYSS